MMPPLKRNQFYNQPIDWAISRTDFDSFSNWFLKKDNHKEKSIQYQLYKRPALLQLIGKYFGVIRPDKIAVELDILGRYTPDIVLIDTQRKTYVMIELEPAETDSIFSGKGKKRHWSSRYEKGFSQCVDWAGEFAINQQNEQTITGLSNANIRNFALIIGRRKFFKPNSLEINRFEQRNSLITHFNFTKKCNYQCIDYDELLSELKNLLSDINK
jgi:hypothetical protein